jgi:hypothetical protein
LLELFNLCLYFKCQLEEEDVLVVVEEILEELKIKDIKKSNYENYQKTRDLCEELSQLKCRIRNKQVKIDIYILQKEKSDSLN